MKSNIKLIFENNKDLNESSQESVEYSKTPQHSSKPLYYLLTSNSL